jgi:hypothetical protein
LLRVKRFASRGFDRLTTLGCHVPRKLSGFTWLPR